MKKIFPLIILFLSIVSCNNKEKGKLTGSLENIPDGTVLNIVDDESRNIITSIPVHQNKFEFSFFFPTPRKIEISPDNPKYPKDRKSLWLENKNIQIIGNFNYLSNAKVTGSPSNDIYEIFRSFYEKAQEKLIELNNIHGYLKDKRMLDSVSSLISSSKLIYKKEVIDIYQKYIDSYIALNYLAAETVIDNSLLDKPDIKVFFDKLPLKYKSSSEWKTIEEYLLLPEAVKTGDSFVDISLSTPDGKTESLSGNLGKITLLEFWNSSCKACRAEHSQMRMLFAKYQKSGLNIIGISTDNNLNDWISAIKHDTVTWLNISDLKGLTSKSAMIYGIKGYPTLILIDEKGKIIDVNHSIQTSEILLKSKLE
jgi:peroxiredoxin